METIATNNVHYIVAEVNVEDMTVNVTVVKLDGSVKYVTAKDIVQAKLVT